jgi:hypothetical protein
MDRRQAIGPRRLLKPISSAQAAIGTVNINRSAIENLFIQSPTNNAGFVSEKCVEYSARTRLALVQVVLQPGLWEDVKRAATPTEVNEPPREGEQTPNLKSRAFQASRLLAVPRGYAMPVHSMTFSWVVPSMK